MSVRAAGSKFAPEDFGMIFLRAKAGVFAGPGLLAGKSGVRVLFRGRAVPENLIVRKFSLAKDLIGVERRRSLIRRKFPPPMRSNVREPGEIPGRLRHCNGYKFQCHCECGKAE
jgi:hypothetical protein